MEVCFSYRCAVTQDQCTATLVLAKSIPRCPVLRCITGSQEGRYIHGELLFIQVRSDPTPVHYNTCFSKKQSPLLSTAVRIRFTAGLCQCNTPMECALHTGAKTSAPQHSVWSKPILAAHSCCTNQAYSRIVSVQSHLEICSSYRCAVTQNQCTATLVFAKGISHCSVLSCKSGT